MIFFLTSEPVVGSNECNDKNFQDKLDEVVQKQNTLSKYGSNFRVANGNREVFFLVEHCS